MKTPILRGQWTGNNNLDSFAVVNLNTEMGAISGRISVLETSKTNDIEYSIWIWSTFKGEFSQNNTFEGKAYIQSIHHRNGNQLTNEEFNDFKKNTGLEYPTEINLVGKILSDTEIEVSTKYAYPTHNNKEEFFKLKKAAKTSSTAPSKQMSWNEFKEFTLEQGDGLIYRGQTKGWPLQTSYHRTGYADIVSYLDNEVIELEHHINSVSNHPYDINEDRSLGALLNLAQHHGYPTPLLDWSKSPYVAAFFAFENKEELKKSNKITIFVFDEKKWSNFAGKGAQIRAPHVLVRTIELPGFNNPRVLPQQALTMYSNINDIEQFIQANEKVKGEFLTRITIDVSEADKAMRDLKLMGLTWGSLFPGFDGICKQLKSRHFN